MRTKIHPSAVLLLALAVLLLPLQWVAAWCISTLVHELGHLLAAWALGIRVHGIELGPGGARIHTEPLSPGQELLCALAGPMCGGALIFLGTWFPRAALCAFVQTACNLLPVGQLDGSRILRSTLELLDPEQANVVCKRVEALTLTVLGIIGGYLSFVLGLGLLPFLWATAMIFRVFREKFLANRQKKGYNRRSNNEEVCL